MTCAAALRPLADLVVGRLPELPVRAYQPMRMCQRSQAEQHLAQGAGIRRVVLVAILTGVIATTAAPAGAHAREPSAATTPDEASLIVCLLNRERVAHGRRPLVWQPQLATMARTYSREMVAGRFFSHVSPGGVNLRDRATATSYLRGRSTWRVGETLAWAAAPGDTPAGIVAAWLASPRHRRVLLDARYRDVGVGVSAGVPVTAGATPGATYAAELGVRGAATRRVGARP
jgi:uncharacterized protein YkwD